jgi:phage terminase large subunit
MARKLRQSEDAEHVELAVTSTFTRNLESDKTIVVNRGGAGSGKSHAVMQLLIYKMLTERNKQILVVRKSLPFLRVSVLLLLYKILDGFKIRSRVREHKVDLNFFFGSNLLHLGSIDDPEKIKSTEWNYIWMEEATEFTYEEYQLIRSRLRAPSEDGQRNRMYLSFNPIDEFHWIKDKLLIDHADEVEEIHSTYKDNPFLIEENKDFLQKSIDYDPNFYRVYALGMWGKLENIVYGVWDTCNSLPPEGTVVYGLDFGYNAESALTKCVVIDRDVYEQELLYQKGLTNAELISQMRKLIPAEDSSKPIYADSAEPDRIKEIKQAGFNIKPANKSVKDGIDFVKRMKIHILSSSLNVQKEKRAYSWKKDKKGNVLDEPIPFLDHLMDAERYALYTHFGQAKEYRIRWF